ncbi:MAG: hypothetical protein QXX38_03190, partial [Candidatus Aenigmatarchaeota archaeon]
TIAYSIMSAVITPDETKIPEKNIINYELNDRQKYILLQNGKVIAKFIYNINCLECLQQKSYLESFATQYSNQIFLEEITNTTTQNSTLFLESLRGYEVLTNVTQENAFNVFCELMLQPPVDCVLRKV